MSIIISTAGLCFGLAALGFGGGAGAATDAAVGLAGLTDWIIGRQQRFGPESAKVMGRIRQKVQHSFAEAYGRETDWSEADLRNADDAMHAALGKGCVITRKELVHAAVAPEGFTKTAVNALMRRLGEADRNRFGPATQGTLSHQYAVAVLTAGVSAAVENEKFFQRMEPELLLEMAGALGQVREDTRVIREDTGALREGQAVHSAQLHAILAAVQDKTGAGEGGRALRAVAERFRLENPSADIADLQMALETAADDYLRLRDQLAALSVRSDRIANLMRAAQEYINAGGFIEADRILADAEALQQEHDTLEAIHTQAATREARISASLLASDVRTAASHMRTIIDWFAPFKKIEAIERAHSYGAQLRAHGERLARAGLEEAITLFAHALSLCDEVDTPAAWAATQNYLGIAYLTHGERLGGATGTAAFDRAIEAFEAALRVYTESDTPADWAGTQTNFGTLYIRQAERLGGAAGTAALDRAIKAFEAALRVYTESDTPADWAVTQGNLGAVYIRQAERFDGAAGTAPLDRAVKAYQAALRVHTKASTPAIWATTQNNLGNVFLMYGQHVEGTAGMAALDRAVEAYQAALTVQTEASTPAAWAMTQNNLGSVHLRRGERLAGEAGIKAFDQAVEAIKAGLKVRTEVDTPFAWAESQGSLGNVYRTNGQRLEGTAAFVAFNRSIEAYKATLRVWTKADTSVVWAMTQNNLGQVKTILADMMKGPESVAFLQEAAAHLEAALQVFDITSMPRFHTSASEDLARVQKRLAEKRE